MVLPRKKNIAYTAAFLGNTFPGVSHWLRMPGLVSWAGVAVGTILAFKFTFRTSAGLGHQQWLLLPAMALLLAAGILLRPALIRFPSFLFFAMLLCLQHRAHQTDVYGFLGESMHPPQQAVLVGKVTSAPLPCHENYHFLLKIDSVCGRASKPLRGLTVNCVCPAAPPQYATVMVRGVFSPPAPRRNPYEYDEFTAMMAQGVWGTFAADACRTLDARRSLPERLSAAFRGVTIAALGNIADFDNRALLQASFLGDTEFLSPFIKNIFRASGIYHLIAISGLNTAILVSALYFFLRLFPLNRMTVHLLCIGALWAYLPFVGMIPSLFRATVMATCVIAAIFFEKKNYTLHTLGLAGTFWFVLSPESLFEPGYQLSFAATAGLLALFPVFSRLTPKPGNRFLRSIVSFLFSSFYVSLASFLATAPVLLYHFGTVSFFGLLANLVAVGAMTAAMWAFFAGLFCQMVLPPLAALPLWASERFLDIVVGTGRTAGLFPWIRTVYPVPPPEMLLLFALFLIGIATVRRELMKPYLLASLIAAALIVPADLLARRPSQRIEAVRFAVPRCSLLGVKWPDSRGCSRVWIIAPDPNRSLPYLIERHAVPWLRHGAGATRFDALVVPDNFGGSADTLRQKNQWTSSARVLAFRRLNDSLQDTLLSLYTPCPRCTCAVVLRQAAIGVRIAAPGFDTTIVFTEHRRSGRRKSVDQEELLTEEMQSAVVMTPAVKGIRTYAVVPPDHPVR
jgi:competence protein ComEC